MNEIPYHMKGYPRRHPINLLSSTGLCNNKVTYEIGGKCKNEKCMSLQGHPGLPRTTGRISLTQEQTLFYSEQTEILQCEWI